jgi:hypothetical protein
MIKATGMRALCLGIVVVLACGGKQSEGRPLSEWVHFHCHAVQWDLGMAAVKYKTFAESVAGARLDAGQRERAESSLLYGAHFRQRSIASMQLHRTLSFCTLVRDLEETRSTALLDRVSLATAAFGERDDPAEMSRAMTELAAVAAELDTLPIRD